MESTVIFENLDKDTEEWIRQTAIAMGFTVRKAYHRIEVDFIEIEQIKDLIAVIIAVRENA